MEPGDVLFSGTIFKPDVSDKSSGRDRSRVNLQFNRGIAEAIRVSDDDLSVFATTAISSVVNNRIYGIPFLLGHEIETSVSQIAYEQNLPIQHQPLLMEMRRM